MKKAAALILIFSLMLSASSCDAIFPKITTASTEPPPKSEKLVVNGTDDQGDYIARTEAPEVTETTAAMIDYAAYDYTFSMPVDLKEYVRTSQGGELGEVFDLYQLAEDLGWKAHHGDGAKNAYNVTYFSYLFTDTEGRGDVVFSLTNNTGAGIQMSDDYTFPQLTSYSVMIMNFLDSQMYWPDQSSNPEHTGFIYNVAEKPESTTFYNLTGVYGFTVAAWEDIVIMSYVLYSVTEHPSLNPIIGTALYDEGMNGADYNFNFGMPAVPSYGDEDKFDIPEIIFIKCVDYTSYRDEGPFYEYTYYTKSGDVYFTYDPQVTGMQLEEFLIQFKNGTILNRLTKVKTIDDKAAWKNCETYLQDFLHDPNFRILNTGNGLDVLSPRTSWIGLYYDKNYTLKELVIQSEYEMEVRYANDPRAKEITDLMDK